MNRYVKMSKFFKIVSTASIGCSGDSGRGNSMPPRFQALCLHRPRGQLKQRHLWPCHLHASGALWRLISQEPVPVPEEKREMIWLVPKMSSLPAAHSMQEIITLTFGFGNSPVLLTGAKVTHLFQRPKWDISLNLLSVTLPGCCHLPNSSGGHWTGHEAPCVGLGWDWQCYSHKLPGDCALVTTYSEPMPYSLQPTRGLYIWVLPVTQKQRL